MFKPSISTFSGVSDCQMILDELQQELQSQFNDETLVSLAALLELLEDKKAEVESRYSRKY